MLEILKKTVKDSDFKKLDSLEVGSWIAAVDPTPEELAYLTDTLGLDKKNITDALDEYELPRIEKDENAIYVLIKVPVENKETVATIPIGIVLTDRYILTIIKKENRVINNIREKKQKIFTTQKINLMTHLFLFASDAYEHDLKNISKEISLRKAKITDLSNKDIVNLIKSEEVLNEFISSFHPMVNIFEKLLGGKYIPLYQQDKDLIEDLLVNSRQTLDLSQSNVKTVINIREAYSTVLSNNLNKIIKVLTFFTIFLAIPTTIASIYGMNIPLPMQDHPQVFNYVATGALLIMSLLFFVFLKKRWI